MMSRTVHSLIADAAPCGAQGRRKAVAVRQRAGVLKTGGHLYLVLMLSLIFPHVCLAAGIAGATGVSIFDTLFIAANGTFSVKGNVYLEKTKVLGKGTLRLQGDSPQQIVSYNSEVTNLEIANPGLVTLKGDLRLTCSLTIKKGTLDAAQAFLQISGSTQVRILAEAKLITRPEVSARMPFAESLFSRTVFAPDAALPSFDYLPDPGNRREPARYRTDFGHYGTESLSTASPPPEPGFTSRS